MDSSRNGEPISSSYRHYPIYMIGEYRYIFYNGAQYGPLPDTFPERLYGDDHVADLWITARKVKKEKPVFWYPADAHTFVPFPAKVKEEEEDAEPPVEEEDVDPPIKEEDVDDGFPQFPSDTEDDLLHDLRVSELNVCARPQEDRPPRDRDDRRERRRDDDRERRRSRSPRGHRSRREEPDFYSSSRRENESRRDRRDDRGGWDRDRGPRRERDDDRRRDYDDRRGGGGGGGRDRRDRDAFGGGRREERKRSATPPVKKREPTPDLTDVIPIQQRQRRMTQWDIKPPGYENITAEQAKLSGMFPLPGAPRQQPMDPQRLQALVNQPQNVAATSALKPTMARQSKRLLVYNVPKSASEEDLMNFFNLQLNGINLIKGADPCQAAHMSKAGNHALLEFKNPSDATVALALDGISMTDDSMDTGDGASNGSSGLSVKRPKDYIGPAASPPSEVQSEQIANDVPDTTEKILITNLAPFLDEEQIKQLLIAIGPLKALVLAVDDSGQSRGFAFCEYANPETTNVAFEGLNNMEIGGQTIKLQRACLGQEQVAADMGVNTMSLLAGTISTTMEKTRVLQMLNMITPEELIRDDDYEDVRDDILEEVTKFAKVESIKIPRPAGARTSPGVGKVYVKLESSEDAQKALAALAGRKFGDRTVVITYFSEEYYDVDAW